MQFLSKNRIGIFVICASVFAGNLASANVCRYALMNNQKVVWLGTGERPITTYYEGGYDFNRRLSTEPTYPESRVSFADSELIRNGYFDKTKSIFDIETGRERRSVRTLPFGKKIWTYYRTDKEIEADRSTYISRLRALVEVGAIGPDVLINVGRRLLEAYWHRLYDMNWLSYYAILPEYPLRIINVHFDTHLEVLKLIPRSVETYASGSSSYKNLENAALNMVNRIFFGSEITDFRGEIPSHVRSSNIDFVGIENAEKLIAKALEKARAEILKMPEVDRKQLLDFYKQNRGTLYAMLPGYEPKKRQDLRTIRDWDHYMKGTVLLSYFNSMISLLSNDAR
jgi:hypothetical protein